MFLESMENGLLHDISLRTNRSSPVLLGLLLGQVFGMDLIKKPYLAWIDMKISTLLTRGYDDMGARTTYRCGLELNHRAIHLLHSFLRLADLLDLTDLHLHVRKRVWRLTLCPLDYLECAVASA